MIYFTSDEHYFHGKVIEYCGRPWNDVNKMNNELIKLHNSIVSPKDTVYHLGDFAMLRKDQIQKIGPILNKLNGTHHLILGNHDEGKPFTYVNMGFASVHTALYVEEFLCIHDPAMAAAVDEKQKVLCGHIHQLTSWINNYILNVGVDVWGYTPVGIDSIRIAFDNRHEMYNIK